MGIGTGIRVRVYAGIGIRMMGCEGNWNQSRTQAARGTVIRVREYLGCEGEVVSEGGELELG